VANYELFTLLIIIILANYQHFVIIKIKCYNGTVNASVADPKKYFSYSDSDTDSDSTEVVKEI
jgi:hypothetical protein